MKETLSSEIPGIALSVWGPNAWGFLHAISFTMPINPNKKEKESYLKFFQSLPDVLPCNLCREHLREIYKKLPIQVESRESCSKWLVDVHNQVNQNTKKPIISYQDVSKMYLSDWNGLRSLKTRTEISDTSSHSKCCGKKKDVRILMGVIAGLLIILIFVIARF